MYIHCLSIHRGSLALKTSALLSSVHLSFIQFMRSSTFTSPYVLQSLWLSCANYRLSSTETVNGIDLTYMDICFYVDCHERWNLPLRVLVVTLVFRYTTLNCRSCCMPFC